METVLENLPLTEEKKMEIRRSRRLRGTMAFPGDAHYSMLALGVASLGGEPTRFENLPASPWFLDFRSALQALGAVFVPAPDQAGHWLVSGGALQGVTGALPQVPELGALILSGIASGSGFAMDWGGSVATHGVRSLLHGLYPDSPATVVLHPKARNACKPYELGWTEDLAKIPLLFHHVAAAEGLLLHLRRPGCDLLENILRHFGVELKIERDDGNDSDELSRRIARQMRAAGKSEPLTRVRLPAGTRVKAPFVSLAGDVGEASVAALAATLIPGSDVTLENVLLNPGRSGFFTALRRMGADIEVTQRRERFGETTGTLRIRFSGLMGKRFDAESLADMRDETFLLLVAAAFAEGESVFRDLDYLRGGESDALKSFIAALKAAGVEIGELEDGLVLRGKGEYDGGTYDALGHPGLAAAYAVLGMKSHGHSTLRRSEGWDWRYSGLLEKLDALATVEKA